MLDGTSPLPELGLPGLGGIVLPCTGLGTDGKAIKIESLSRLVFVIGETGECAIPEDSERLRFNISPLSGNSATRGCIGGGGGGGPVGGGSGGGSCSMSTGSVLDRWNHEARLSLDLPDLPDVVELLLFRNPTALPTTGGTLLRSDNAGGSEDGDGKAGKIEDDGECKGGDGAPESSNISVATDPSVVMAVPGLIGSSADATTAEGLISGGEVGDMEGKSGNSFSAGSFLLPISLV